MIRTTTNSVLHGYKYNLQRSSHTMNKARVTVLTQRNFNSFAEDPAAAATCFQMRRSFQKTSSQYEVSASVGRKFDIAWTAMETVIEDVSNRISDSAYAAVIKAQTDTTGSGRRALGETMKGLAGSIVRTMNVQYGDSFVFAGADGKNAPLVLDETTGEITYRDISVNSNDARLDYLVKNEKVLVDLGLGMHLDQNGNTEESSTFNAGIHAIDFLGYGVDANGDPENVASVVWQIGDILSRCDPGSGAFEKPEDAEKLGRLAKKLEVSVSNLSGKHVELDTRKGFLDANQAQLKENAYNLQEQFLSVEDADMADAITSFSYAKYCYDAALKVGNSILSQSLMDYLNN